MFIHFLHEQTLRLYGIGKRIRSHREIVRSARSALHLCAFISPDPLIMPTSDIVQSSIAPGLFSDLRFLTACEALYLVGSTVDVEQLQAGKRAHFTDTSFQGQWESIASKRRLRTIQPSLQARNIDTTADVKSRWLADIDSLAGTTARSRVGFPVLELRNAYHSLPPGPSSSTYERALAVVPERLGSHAFLWDVVDDLKIFDLPITPEAKRRIELALGWNWAMSYLDEYRTTMASRIPRFGYVDCGVRTTHPHLLVDLVAYRRALGLVGLLDAFERLTLPEIMEFRDSSHSMVLRDGLLRQLHDHFLAPTATCTDRLRHLSRLCSDLRDVAAACASPRSAMEAVVARAEEQSDVSRRVGGTPRRSERERETTVLIVLALAEETAVVLERAREIFGDLAVLEDDRTGQVSYETRWCTDRKCSLRIVFSMVGKGQERAAAATASMLARISPRIVVNIGIAGSLSSDVRIGDVLVADQVLSYLDNARAVPKGEKRFQLNTAGATLRSDDFLTHRAEQLPFIAPKQLARARERLADCMKETLPSAEPVEQGSLVVGALACGPVVSASRAFNSWLHERKRDLAAIDMESSGIASAAAIAGMLKRVRFLALRGISDMADENKSELERSTRGAVRQISIAAAFEILIVLLNSLPKEAFE